MTTTKAKTIDDGATLDHWEVFERCRRRLHGIAFRIVGSAEDAEDVVQDASLRWLRADIDSVRAPEGWLVTAVTRLSVDRVRRAATERQVYLRASDLGLDPASDSTGLQSRAELATGVSDAFRILRGRLAPAERTAFVLREVFACGYDEVARVLEKSEVACRQIVHRARERVRRPWPSIASRADDPPELDEQLAERFVSALARGDRGAVLAALDDETNAASRSDGRRARAFAGQVDSTLCSAA
jgi:RNA polymerase sigma-70 factor (ECF subfamily)